MNLISLSKTALSYDTFVEMLSSYIEISLNRKDLLKDMHVLIKNTYIKNGMAYHNLDHISDCLTNLFLNIEKIQELESSKISEFEISALFAAIYFHDIIYVPMSSDNESLSVAASRTYLTVLGCDNHFISEVKRLILATKHDTPPKKVSDSIIMDIDLAGLALPWVEFTNMTEKIYKEFSFLERDVFIKGRKKFFEKMLSRGPIYHTVYFYTQLESKAQDNLKKFIKEFY